MRISDWSSDVCSSDLPEFRTTLDNIASTLGSYNQTYVDVYGHTDSTGADAHNMTLSRNRAESVAGYLSTHGVARARIGTQGFGETQPVADNATHAGRRSEASRGGEECVSTCNYRWSPYHQTKKTRQK